MRKALITATVLLTLLVPVSVHSAAQTPSIVARTPLPSDRLHFGLGNGPGSDLNWLTATGVPWKYRYQYLAGGINTGTTTGDPNCGPNVGWQTWNSPAGAFATFYINASVAANTIPVFTYYEIVQSNPSQGVESALPTKITTLCTMQAYWADFTVLMQKVGAYGGQAVVHVEPDFWGFMQHQNADPTAIPADVANTGDGDLAGLPNTVAGMGLAFLKLRDKYAPNALLGIHASSWASGIDIGTDQNPSTNASAEADKVAAFLNKAGISGNPSGITPWDVVVNDVADHDAGWYNPVSDNHWWDRNNVLLPNFSRWLTFMSRLHADTGLPSIVWQVPVGNQYFKTMNNSTGHYQDNRAEYFIGHPADLLAAGLVAVLFGKANANQTTYTDFMNDGVTNPAPVVSFQCNLCNTHDSAVPDDDGGYLRMAVGAYYAGTAPCSSVTLTAAPPSSTIAGNPVTATASTSGCTNPQYRFWLKSPAGTWTMVQDYSASSTFNWTTTTPAGAWYIGVHVRGASSSAPYDAATSIPYKLTGTQCTAVTLSPAPSSPSTSGTQITLTASGTCPSANPSYEFWAKWSGYTTWQLLQGWSTSPQFHWNSTGAAAGIETFGVWVKDAGSTASVDAYTSIPYTISSASCASATLVASPTSVAHSSGTHITLTATATGCSNANPLYEFWMRPAWVPSWTVVQSYSTSATYDWNTAGAPAGTIYFGVWVRDAGSTQALDASAGATVTVT